MKDTQMDDANVALETPPSNVFIPPSINKTALVRGDSYTYFSPVHASLVPSPPPQSDSFLPSKTGPFETTQTTTAPPAAIAAELSPSTPCILGIDEAGRGPVLGPMVYSAFYARATDADSLLRHPSHRFDDSKALTPATRSALMVEVCSPSSDLHEATGWAVSVLSARDIAAGMLSGADNLNAQAFDATVALIRGVMARGVCVRAIFVDTVGPPATYQRRLEREFPTAAVTVTKKADSLFPCVSAASVCAKVTRDAALETLYRARRSGVGEEGGEDKAGEEESMAWGSGYPSDGRCVTWLKQNMHPVFGWGPECRFSWGTAKDMLDAKGPAGAVQVEWPVDDNDGGENNTRLTDFFVGNDELQEQLDGDELGTWFGRPVGLEAF